MATFAAAVAVGGTQASAQAWRLGYEAWLSGLLIASAEVDLHLSQERYAVESRARTRGVANLLYNWEGRSLSFGRLEQDAAAVQDLLVPERHENVGLQRGRMRQVWLVYDGGGSVTYRLDPPPGEERDAVPPDLTGDTLDPLSGFLAVALASGGAPECRGELRLFDGKRRYDATLEPGPERSLEPRNYALYAGPARRCDIAFERIAGFWRGDGEEEPRREYVEDPQLWVARVPGAGGVPALPAAIPVRLEGQTALGSLVVHLSKIDPLPATEPGHAGVNK